MTHATFDSRPLSGRVYRAILTQALPYVVSGATIGAVFGALLGLVASLASVDTISLPIMLLYTTTGFIIGTAVGIRPVFRELLAFHWSADVLGK